LQEEVYCTRKWRWQMGRNKILCGSK